MTEQARKRWLAERPEYERFTKHVVKRLRAEVRKEGIWALVDGRAKDVDSLVRKLVKKPMHTYESLGDKAGVRAIVRYKDEINLVLSAAARVFECSKRDEKGRALKHDRVGYLSTHVDVCLRKGDRSTRRFPPTRFRAELQVRTLGQHLWSEMSHDTF
jgi:putative GTP pyrophosphokinase